jgi:hypothetical protein
MAYSVNTNASDTANPTASSGGNVQFGAVSVGGGVSNTTWIIWGVVAVVILFLLKGKK